MAFPNPGSLKKTSTNVIERKQANDKQVSEENKEIIVFHCLFIYDFSQEIVPANFEKIK